MTQIEDRWVVTKTTTDGSSLMGGDRGDDIRDRLQIILYKAFRLLLGVIKNFIGSFEKLSDIKPDNNQ